MATTSCANGAWLCNTGRSHEPLDRLLPEAFALVREAGRKTLNMRHFDVQILGGVAMHHGSIVEMQTGEGKTLAATLPLYLNALTGKGVHLATANDYLARRDAEWMSPIYKALGLSVGIIEGQMPQDERRKQYACDVTYGTAKEFGFDFLRDRLLLRRIREGQRNVVASMLGHKTGGGGEQPVQRGEHFALVDEADSLLIDEARTPLIISAMPSEEAKVAVECYKWAAEVADEFVEEEHYEYDEEKKKVELTSDGRLLVRRLPKPPALNPVGIVNIYEHIERAVKVNRDYILDRHYVVREGEIVIVDEFTGRLGEGRKWRAGIHQAIEAKEDVEVTVETGQAAQITLQELFARYERLAGMTGTAVSSARELRKMYKVRVIPVPTNRPSQRQRLPDEVFGDQDAKWSAIIDEVRELHAAGRPLLIGTRSIDKSELLSKLLTESGIEHEVLNAKNLPREAEIVKRAGDRGKVTVATNMAGRGTDIKLADGVEEMGGLHVICTEMHDSARIDRQLIGRCGRQGDRGTFRQFLALDDDILEVAYGFKKASRLKSLGAGVQSRFDHLRGIFRKAQRKTERRHFRDRKQLMYFAKQRRKMFAQMGHDPYLDVSG